MKNKNLGRAFLLSYLVAIFAGMVFGLLLVKANLALAIVLMIVALLDLGGIIAARVLFKNYFQLFIYFSLASFGLLNVLTLAGFVTEMIFTIMGQPAPYAWFVSSLGLALLVVIDLSYYFGVKKIKRSKLIEAGVIKEFEEEEI